MREKQTVHGVEVTLYISNRMNWQRWNCPGCQQEEKAPLALVDMAKAVDSRPFHCWKCRQ